MSNIVNLPDPREAEATKEFANYVQSTAFNLTLSRSMIAALHIIRDYDRLEWKDRTEMARDAHGNRADNFVGFFRAIRRRGLAYHIWPLPEGDDGPNYRLTEAGKKVCELLVIAGLMPAAEKKARKRA